MIFNTWGRKCFAPQFSSVVSRQPTMVDLGMEFFDMMFNTKLIVAFSASALVGSFAAADMTGSVYQHQYNVSAVDGFGAPDFNGTVVDLWMEFNDDADILLNVYNFNDANLGTTYYQSFTGATWLPNNLGAPFETDALQYADSYVSIGGYNGGSQPGNDGTGLDPNFGGAAAAGPGTNAGWYNSDPGNPIGAVVSTGHTDTGLGVFIGRFSMQGALDFTMEGSYGSFTWNQGLGTSGVQGDFAVVPAPGVLALLGLAGLAGRRRR